MAPSLRWRAAVLLWACGGASSSPPAPRACPCLAAPCPPALMAEPAPDMALTAWTGDPERPLSLAALVWPMEMSWRSAWAARAWAARAWARPLKELAAPRGQNPVCLYLCFLLSWEEGRGLLSWVKKSPSRKIATARGRGPSLGTSCSCLGRGDTRGGFFKFFFLHVSW